MNSSTPALEGPASRVRLTVAYDGRGFHGFAVNAGVLAVTVALAGLPRLPWSKAATCPMFPMPEPP